MPAIHPERLKQETAELTVYFSEPARFVNALEGLLDRYADRVRRPGQTGAPAPLLASYKVAAPVMRQIMLVLTPLPKADPPAAIIVIIILILKSSKHIFLYFWLNGLLLLLDILILFFVCIFLQFFLFEKKLRFAVAHQINQRIDILIIIITNIKAILKSFEFHPVVPDLFANHPSRLILMSSHPFMTLDCPQVNSLLRISI